MSTNLDDLAAAMERSPGLADKMSQLLTHEKEYKRVIGRLFAAGLLEVMFKHTMAELRRGTHPSDLLVAISEAAGTQVAMARSSAKKAWTEQPDAEDEIVRLCTMYFANAIRDV